MSYAQHEFQKNIENAIENLDSVYDVVNAAWNQYEEFSTREELGGSFAQVLTRIVDAQKILSQIKQGS